MGQHHPADAGGVGGGLGHLGAEAGEHTEASTRLTTTTIITALTVDDVNSPICRPTKVAASVAAAWATDSPNTTPDLGVLNPNSGLHSTAASSLPPTQATTNTPASPSVPGSTSTCGSITVPIDTRNVGMSSDEPKNSMRSMNSPSLGTMPVEGQPAEEGADDALDADDLGHHGGRQQGGEHEGVAQRARLADAAEEPLGDRRQDAEREADEEGQAEHDLEDELDAAGVAGRRPRDEGQDHQRQRVGEHGRADRGRHGPVGGQAHVAHDGVGDERVRREQRAQEHRAGHAVADEQPADRAEDQRRRNVSAMNPMAWLR